MKKFGGVRGPHLSFQVGGRPGAGFSFLVRRARVWEPALGEGGSLSPESWLGRGQGRIATLARGATDWQPSAISRASQPPNSRHRRKRPRRYARGRSRVKTGYVEQGNDRRPAPRCAR